MQWRKYRIPSGIAVLLAVAGLTLTSVSDVAAGTARPGASDVGDYLFPGLGNGGYDAEHYDLTLRYPTAAPAQQVQGTVTMNAAASQDLSSFNLDFGGDTVGSVRVNGRPAQFDWQQKAEELVITPAKSLCRGRTFTVEVVFTSHITAPEADNLFPVGWIATPHGSFTSFQPDAAHRSIPVNDHPSDKATWQFSLDVPQGFTAVTNGVPAGQRTANGRTVWTSAERSPLAAELIQLAVGDDLSVVDRGTVAGVQLRDVIPSGERDLLEPAFTHGPSQLQWLVAKVGQFPFATYGNFGADLRYGYSLENQGISTHSVGLFDPTFLPQYGTGQAWFYDPIMIHEAAHQWYGDSVAPERWSDIWLNEGWATWYEKQYEQESGTIDEWGFPSIEEYMKDQYSQGDNLRALHGPVAHPLSGDDLFNQNVYDGGALVLYALQQQVGEEKFQAIQRGWAQRFRGGSASTDDFIAFASRTAKQDLTGFLQAWLHGDHTPTMPGHPDWVVNPVTAKTSAEAPARHPSGRAWVR